MFGHRGLRGLMLALCCAFALVSDVHDVGAQTNAFVSRSGAELTLAGASWRFVAFNDYQLTSLPGGYTCGRPIDTPTLNAILQDDAASGATVIRTWFFQSYYDLDAQGQQTRPSWAAFDRVLSAAARYGLKVIPVLVNEYPQCEPNAVTKNLGFFQGAYAQAGYGYPLSFKQYATAVAAHYADDSTVAFWQIGNELYDDTPSGCTASAESQGARALRSFADTMTGAIKAADPNHLVSLGTQGSGQCGLAGDDYQTVMAGAVDLCEYHDYGDVTHSIPDDGYNRLAQRIAQCRALNKPLFIGESGIPADVGDNGQETGTISQATLDLRAGFFAAKMSAAFNAGVVGYALWDKEQDASNSTWNINSDGDFEVGAGDPTDAVTAAVAETFGAYPGTIRTSFEDGGVDGWSTPSGPGQATLGNSTTEAWGGSKALAVSLGGADHESVELDGTDGLGAGSQVTLHVFAPVAAPDGEQFAPYVTDASGDQLSGAATTLEPGWNTVSWTVPASLTGGASALGATITDPNGWSGTLYLDDVAWSEPGTANENRLPADLTATGATTTSSSAVTTSSAATAPSGLTAVATVPVSDAKGTESTHQKHSHATRGGAGMPSSAVPPYWARKTRRSRQRAQVRSAVSVVLA